MKNTAISSTSYFSFSGAPSLSALEKLTDTELYRKCKYYGEAARI